MENQNHLTHVSIDQSFAMALYSRVKSKGFPGLIDVHIFQSIFHVLGMHYLCSRRGLDKVFIMSNHNGAVYLCD